MVAGRAYLSKRVDKHKCVMVAEVVITWANELDIHF